MPETLRYEVKHSMGYIEDMLDDKVADAIDLRAFLVDILEEIKRLEKFDK